MLFSTGTFIFLFLPVSLAGYQLLSRFGRTALLSWFAIISCFFYGYWNPRYLLLLLASITTNYLFSLMIARQAISDKARGHWLTAAISSNLLLLMWFKYLFPVLGFFSNHGLLHHRYEGVILPLGISFFTFTQIAYLIDLRQGIARHQGLLSYTVFVTFFPHLIAGPIIHPREIMPQLESDRLDSLRIDDVNLGLSWFILGLAKKVLLADVLATRADELFAHPSQFGLVATWLGALCYAMQLYFDFSGYSDMAVGLARMFSIEFPFNFNSPFKSPSIIEFWTRWHMTLSRYLAEYLYTPILRAVNSRRMDQGKKVSRKAQATLEGFTQMVFFPVMSTMFLAGVWHGAGLQYLVFGVMHGCYLAVNHAWRLFTPKGHWLHGKLPRPLSIAITFLSVLAGMVFFRAANCHDASYVLGSMLGLHAAVPLPFASFAKTIGKLACAAFIVWCLPNTQQILGQQEIGIDHPPVMLPRLSWGMTARWSLALMLIFCASILMLDTSTSFLYFQF